MTATQLENLMSRDPEYTDTLEITYSAGEPGTPSFVVAKIIAKHPNEPADLERFVVDLAGTTVAAYMAETFAGMKMLSYRPVESRRLMSEAQVRGEQTPLSQGESDQ